MRTIIKYCGTWCEYFVQQPHSPTLRRQIGDLLAGDDVLSLRVAHQLHLQVQRFQLLGRLQFADLHQGEGLPRGTRHRNNVGAGLRIMQKRGQAKWLR